MPKKILIIEDTDDIADALQLLLEMRGYEAVVARDGFEGCLKAREEEPDLILMDIALPGLDGIEATREIRSHPEGSDTPIICVSSYASGREKEIRMAGCNEVMSKITLIDSLDATLRKYLGQ
jgi:two-component system, cell cycle response regulator DivK